MRNTSSSWLGRITTVLVMLSAWFALSNHCVLGTACASINSAAKSCPMHMKSPETPSKQNDSNRDAPCCKTLRAVSAAKVSATANTLDFVLKEYFSKAGLPEISQPSALLLALDTGPPAALSFSESVLQRSILAHAPPRFV